MINPALLQNALVAGILLFQWPVGILVRKYVKPQHRKLVHLVLGLSVCFALFRFDFLFVLAGVVVSYGLMHLPNPACLATLIIPVVGLFGIHYYRLKTFNTSGWKTDLSGLVMFMSLRIWVTVFNVFDGRKKELKRAQWAQLALKKIPSFMNYLAYMFGYNGVNVGPIVPYKVFSDSCDLVSTDAEIKEDISAGFKQWICAFCFCAYYAVGVSFLPASIIQSDEFKAKPYIIKLVISIIMSATHITRYMFGWMASQAGMISLGMSRVKDFDFGNCQAVRVKEYFTKRMLPELANEWNHVVHFVLKEFLHIRLLGIGIPNICAKLVTFTFSAFWHGLFSGYYFMAICEALIAFVDVYRAKKFTPIIAKVVGERAAWVFDSVWVQCLNFFIGAPWDLYWASCYVDFFTDMKFGPFIALVVMSGIGFLFGPKRKRAPPKQE